MNTPVGVGGGSVSKPNSAKIKELKKLVSQASSDEVLCAARKNLAFFTAEVFAGVGEKLYGVGYIFRTDRRKGKSPFGFGSDEVVAMSVLLRMGGQLISASAQLLTEGKPYAGAALSRQIVEIEYLAWAFDTRDQDAERWLRSDKAEREKFFRPAKLREAAGDRFRGKDYGFHCELGGHPVPTGTILLRDDRPTIQLLLSDLIGHSGGAWDHFVGWARQHEDYTEPFKPHAAVLSQKFQVWKT